jgi:hypothetical protein
MARRGSGRFPEQREELISMRKTAVLTALAVATGTVAAVSLSAAGSANAATTELFGTMTTNTSSYSDATTDSIKVHDLTSGEQVVVRCYTKGQTFGGSDVWFRIGKDDQLGFVPRATIDVPVTPPACDTV